MGQYRSHHTDCGPRFDQSFTGACEQQSVETVILQKRFLENKAKKAAKKADKKQPENASLAGNLQSSVHVVSTTEKTLSQTHASTICVANDTYEPPVTMNSWRLFSCWKCGHIQFHFYFYFFFGFGHLTNSNSIIWTLKFYCLWITIYCPKRQPRNQMVEHSECDMDMNEQWKNPKQSKQFPHIPFPYNFHHTNSYSRASSEILRNERDRMEFSHLILCLGFRTLTHKILHVTFNIISKGYPHKLRIYVTSKLLKLIANVPYGCSSIWFMPTLWNEGFLFSTVFSLAGWLIVIVAYMLCVCVYVS